jgi:hypothetical protein
MKNNHWFNKFGKLIIILLSLILVCLAFVPIIALPNEKAELVNYTGLDVVFGKELGMILFNGVYFANAIINPTPLLFIGFFLPIFIALISSLLIKNRRVVGFSCAISFLVSIVMLLMVRQMGTCYLTNTNTLTGLNELTRYFKDIDGVLKYGAYVGAGVSTLGLFTSIVYTFADYLQLYRR